MRSSLLMGTGTVLSRLGGVLRGIALAAALGAGVVADAFTLGNTLPNVVYILIIGGALNAVFIPQLVRHMKDDVDGGDGYADRLITVVGVALLAVSIVAVLIAPWLVGLYATSQYTQDQFDLAVAFARFCLPQIFFYGVYTMLSQVLNAAGRFGAPMFAPLVNNVDRDRDVRALHGRRRPGRRRRRHARARPGHAARRRHHARRRRCRRSCWCRCCCAAATATARGSTGRASGLRTAGGLAAWTIGLVLVNQLAYAVIVRLATSVNAVSQGAGDTPAGLTAYTNAHLMFILPHSVITVSLVAALLPRMSRAAHDGRRADLATDVSSGMRSASSLIIPASVGLLVLGTQAGVLLFNYGQTSTQSAQVTGALAAVFALGLLPFTLYYVILRGVLRPRAHPHGVLGHGGAQRAQPRDRRPAVRDAAGDQRPSPSNLALLAIGYVAAYWLTLVVAWIVLSRAIGGLRTRETLRGHRPDGGRRPRDAPRHGRHARADRRPGARQPQDRGHPDHRAGRLGSGCSTYLGAARLLRIAEVTDVLAMLRRRLPGR